MFDFFKTDKPSLDPARLEGESFESYRERRDANTKAAKSKLKGVVLYTTSQQSINEPKNKRKKMIREKYGTLRQFKKRQQSARKVAEQIATNIAETFPYFQH